MQLLTSAQYMFPVTADDMLRLVLFCDAGTVEEDYTLRDENFRVSLGFGLRVLVPAMGPAPLAFDFAWPVAKAPGDVTEVFSFFIGIGR
jgi:outer membrane protein insertion porin family